MTATYYLGVDASEPSRAAVRWGLRRAVERNAAVELVHVVDDEWGQLGHSYAQEANRRATELLADELTSALVLNPALRISTRMLRGGPSWELAALPTPDDLLIIGTHKTGVLHGRVLGSRSVQIASAARSSVAIVPDTPHETRRGVVVGVDRFEGSTSAVACAAWEAQELGQDLLLVHAQPNRTGSAEAQGTPDAQGKAEDQGSAHTEAGDEGQRLLLAAAEIAAVTAPSVTVRRHSARSLPAEALLDASHDASLLVLGVSHPRRDGQALIGSVTHDVLMNINVPVLIARHAARVP